MSFLRIAASITAAGCFASVTEAQVSYPIDLKIGVHTENAKRNTSLSDAMTSSVSSSIQVLEAVISPAEGGGGIGGRLLRGTFDTDELSLKEGLIYLGAQWFRVEGAYGQRSLAGSDSTVTFARAGARSITKIGGSGVSLSFSGSKYFAARFEKAKPKAGEVSGDPDGWEGETSIFYTAPKVPVYAQLGYRTEYFSYLSREENIHGVIFGAGLWLGGR